MICPFSPFSLRVLHTILRHLLYRHEAHLPYKESSPGPCGQELWTAGGAHQDWGVRLQVQPEEEGMGRQRVGHLKCFVHIHVQYRHLIPAAVDRTSVFAWLYKHSCITCQKNKPNTSVIHVHCESKLHSVVRLPMHPRPRNWLAFGHAVMYYARAAHIFCAGIICLHCICLVCVILFHEVLIVLVFSCFGNCGVFLISWLVI